MLDEKRIKEYEDGVQIIEENLVNDIAKSHNIGRPLNSCAGRSLYYGKYLEDCIKVVEDLKGEWNRMILQEKIIRMQVDSNVALIEALAMQAENMNRLSQGLSIAYTEESFGQLIKDHNIGHNDIITRIQNATYWEENKNVQNLFGSNRVNRDDIMWNSFWSKRSYIFWYDPSGI